MSGVVLGRRNDIREGLSGESGSGAAGRRLRIALAGLESCEMSSLSNLACQRD